MAHSTALLGHLPLNKVLFGLSLLVGELRHCVNCLLGTGRSGGGTGGNGGTGGGHGGTGGTDGTGTTTGGTTKRPFPLISTVFSTHEFLGVYEFDGNGLA